MLTALVLKLLEDTFCDDAGNPVFPDWGTLVVLLPETSSAEMVELTLLDAIGLLHEDTM